MRTGIFQVFPKTPHFLQLKLQTFLCLGSDSACALDTGEGEAFTVSQPGDYMPPSYHVFWFHGFGFFFFFFLN